MTFPHHIIGLLKKSSGWTLCPEYEAVYNSYITKPSDPDAEVDNAMVLGWVNDGVWVKKDGLWVFANHVAGADSLRNWKSPSGTLATAYNSPVHGIWEGYTGNGSNAYIDLNWIPSVNGVNYQLNSASMLLYTRTNVTSDGSHGTNYNTDNKNLEINPRSSSNNAWGKCNNTTLLYYANTDGRGMYAISRTASDLTTLYKNKVAIKTATNIPIGLPTKSIYCLAYNDDGVAAGFRADQVSVIALGLGLTQTDIDNITDRFQTRMTYHGTQV